MSEERIRRCGPLSICARNGHVDRLGDEPIEDHVWNRKARAEAETGYPMDTYSPSGELIAWDREEADECERGTLGCSVHHTRESECETW